MADQDTVARAGLDGVHLAIDEVPTIASSGPEQFAAVAPAEAAQVWVSDEYPTEDPQLFGELAAQLSPLQG